MNSSIFAYTLFKTIAECRTRNMKGREREKEKKFKMDKDIRIRIRKLHKTHLNICHALVYTLG